MTTRPQRASVVILAAGRGERAGESTEGPKQYRRIGGLPILARSIAAFAAMPSIDRIVVVIHPDDRELLAANVPDLPAGTLVVEGGASRQASTLRALEALVDTAPFLVLIHDAVRPFVDGALVERVVSACGPAIGAVPALPVSDTLKRAAAGGLVEETVPRAGLYGAQTPQGFPFAAIIEAHRRAALAEGAEFTDDASIAEWTGLPVRIVEGSADNFKITWARDIAMAEERLRAVAPSFPDVRTGNGYDVHGFEPGDHVTLCGVEIAHGKRLSGHSDADVGLHALTDALLATCGEGDIGTHFPPSDPQWKGAASRIFVEHAASIVRSRGGRIAHADVTLIAEAPKVGPHRAAMTAAMAAMLGISPERVSVKATTNERLGFVGREEGIAAIATATVVYPGSVPE